MAVGSGEDPLVEVAVAADRAPPMDLLLGVGALEDLRDTGVEDLEDSVAAEVVGAVHLEVERREER